MQEGRVLGARKACSSMLKGVFFNDEGRVLVRRGLKTLYNRSLLCCTAKLFLCFFFAFLSVSGGLISSKVCMDRVGG